MCCQLNIQYANVIGQIQVHGEHIYLAPSNRTTLIKTYSTSAGTCSLYPPPVPLHSPISHVFARKVAGLLPTSAVAADAVAAVAESVAAGLPAPVTGVGIAGLCCLKSGAAGSGRRLLAAAALELGYRHKPVAAVAAAKVAAAGTDINWQLHWGLDAGPAAEPVVEPVAGVGSEAESAAEEAEKKPIPLGSIAAVARGSLSRHFQGRKAMTD